MQHRHLSNKTVKKHWRILSKWIRTELGSLAGQEDTSDLYRAMEAVEAHMKIIDDVSRRWCYDLRHEIPCPLPCRACADECSKKEQN